MRRLGFLLLLAVAGAAAVWFLAPGAPTRAAGERSFRTELVERGDLAATVSATGTINPTATTIVGTQVSGQVVEILADHNSVVRAGDVLARLNSEQVRARLDAARADLAQARATNAIQRATVDKVRAEIRRAEAAALQAEAQLRGVEAVLEEARRALARQRDLAARGVGTAVALMAAETQVATQTAQAEQARAQIAAAVAQRAALAADLVVAETTIASGAAQVMAREAQVRQIEVDLRNTEVRASVDGVVIQRNIELGQTVAASLQAPTLFLVAEDLNRVEIYANIDEADVGRLQPGQPVSFSVTAYPNRRFEGEVRMVRLGAQTIQNVVIYTAIIRVPNADNALKPGMTATLRILVDRRQGVLKVPNAALRWRPPGDTARPSTPAAMPNPFSAPPPPSPMGAAPGGGGRGGAQMLDRLALELELSPEQRARAEGIARALRDREGAAPPVRGAERERARAFRAALLAELSPHLSDRQRSKLALLAEGGDAGTPGRVFIVGSDGQPQPVAVRLGLSDGLMTEVLAGDLAEGAAVIVGVAPRGPARRGPFGS